MDLIELRQALRRGWLWGVLLTIIVAVGATVALGPVDTRFTASTTLLVTPRAERFQTVSTGVLRIVLPNVLVVARSHEVQDATASEVGDLRDVAIETDATFLHESGVLTLSVKSSSAEAATVWSGALAESLVERYDDDLYLIVSVLDLATSASPPGGLERTVDLAGVALLSFATFILTVFALQRLRESGDVVARVRSGGLRVLAELDVPGRRSRPRFTGDDRARRLALALAGAPEVTPGDRLVVISADTRPAVAVVDALRAGLESVGLGDRHKVVLGPELDDLPSLQREANTGAVCVPVLDRTQRIDEFVQEIQAIIDAGVPVVGVVLVHRMLVSRRGSQRLTDRRARRRRDSTRGVSV